MDSRKKRLSAARNAESCHRIRLLTDEADLHGDTRMLTQTGDA